MVSPFIPSQPVFPSVLPGASLGGNTAAPLNNLLASLPTSNPSPLAGGNPAATLNTQVGSLPFSTNSLLAGSNVSGALNNLLTSLPFSMPSPLAGGNPAGLLNTLAGTGFGDGLNPFGGALQTPMTPVVPGAQTGQLGGDAQLQASLARIQQDPEGAQLLQAALAKGYTIQVGDPSAAGQAARASGMALRDNCPVCQAAAAENGVTVEGLTLTGNGRNQIIVSPTAQDFDKTLVHELYHAATDDNGTSKTEEATANIIGDRVSARVNGRQARDPQAIINETFPLYPELPINN